VSRMATIVPKRVPIQSDRLNLPVQLPGRLAHRSPDQFDSAEPDGFLGVQIHLVGAAEAAGVLGTGPAQQRDQGLGHGRAARVLCIGRHRRHRRTARASRDGVLRGAHPKGTASIACPAGAAGAAAASREGG
jgi:hypothetical protein